MQVDIVRQFKNMQLEMNQLADVQLPTLEVDDVKSLALEGWYLICSMCATVADASSTALLTLKFLSPKTLARFDFSYK